MSALLRSPLTVAAAKPRTPFGDKGSGLVKVVAGYRQFHAVEHVVGQTAAAASLEGKRRIGAT